MRFERCHIGSSILGGKTLQSVNLMLLLSFLYSVVIVHVSSTDVHASSTVVREDRAALMEESRVQYEEVGQEHAGKVAKTRGTEQGGEEDHGRAGEASIETRSGTGWPQCPRDKKDSWKDPVKEFG